MLLSNGLSKVLGFCKYNTNYFVFDIFNYFNFEYFIHYNLIKCMWSHTSRVFLVFHPMLCWYVGTMYEDIFNNDFNAIVSQINFVQQREPSSMFLGILNCLLVLLLCLLMSLSTTFSFTL